MNWFQELLSNPFLLIGLSSWFWAQLIKTIIHAIVTKSIDFTRLIGDGGMPSGHSATVSSLATAAALVYGLGSFEFAMAFIFAIVVCKDAMGVRLETGRQAVIINDIVEAFNSLASEKLPEAKLKEFVGHTAYCEGKDMTLFINCCPRGESRTEKLARALLKALGEYEELRLYDEPLHPLGRADIAKRDALLAEKKYDDEMFRYARQFAAADRIVIAAPLWDLSFPAQLKVYLENIYVTGIVTKYNEAGKPVGLCRANELYYVTTSGGPFDGRFGYDYWKTIAQDCFGIPTVKLLKAENLDIVGADAEKIVDDAIKAYGLA